MIGIPQVELISMVRNRLFLVGYLKLFFTSVVFKLDGLVGVVFVGFLVGKG